MTKKEQQAYVRAMGRTNVNDICTHIRSSKIPDTRDGHALRALLSHYFALSAKPSVILREPRRARAKAYRNHILITPGL